MLNGRSLGSSLVKGWEFRLGFGLRMLKMMLWMGFWREFPMGRKKFIVLIMPLGQHTVIHQFLVSRLVLERMLRAVAEAGGGERWKSSKGG